MWQSGQCTESFSLHSTVVSQRSDRNEGKLPLRKKEKGKKKNPVGSGIEIISQACHNWAVINLRSLSSALQASWKEHLLALSWRNGQHRSESHFLYFIWNGFYCWFPLEYHKLNFDCVSWCTISFLLLFLP